jgi:hypothetical protein
MKIFKYCCAAMALSYLVSALLPISLVGPHQAVIPEWIGRGIFITNFLVLAVISYGLHTERESTGK